jgi:hyperosmotically inducible periplasmic protein
MKKHFNPLLMLLIIAMPYMLTVSCKEKDSNIQSAVEATLKNNPDMSGVSAFVKDGVVTLTGECNDEMSKSAAESSIKNIKGVKQVINNCTVAAAQPAPAPVVIAEDDPLTKGVKDATKDYPGVNATVQDGVITLTGDIKKADLQKLMMTLHTLKPKKIDNKLTVK